MDLFIYYPAVGMRFDLPLCERLGEAHGGTINAKSTVS
jgi:hypothetical protein